MKKILLALVLVLGMAQTAAAPVKPVESIRLKVRITAYSPKQIAEGNKNAIGKCAKNEDGVSVSRYLRQKYDIDNGDTIVFSDGDRRIVDDKPARWAERKFKGKLVDRRFYESIKSKPETRAVNKELRKFDLAWDWITIIKK